VNFKRPREYVFVREIPKSPVGKVLRRKLVAGEYESRGAKRPSSHSLLQTFRYPVAKEIMQLNDLNHPALTLSAGAGRLPRRDRPGA
jgi:hypothetical protein